jgi:glycosyltransferase involved in cell wall biosynthesis
MSAMQSEGGVINGGAADAAPLLSVIIPCYNAAPYIVESLESALAQTLKSIEVIVVNDGSPDTEEFERLLRPYEGKFVYLKQENRGLSGARNTAIRAARGKYIGLLDADDAWMPRYAEEQVRRLEADPNIDVLYPDAVLFGEVEEEGHTYMEKCPSVGDVSFGSLLREECHVMICVTMRRDTCVRLGMFDENLRSVEDFDLWLRVLNSGGTIRYYREPLARHRKRKGSLSANALAMGNYMLKVLDKSRANMTLAPNDLHDLDTSRRLIVARMQIEQGKEALKNGDYRTSLDKIQQANTHYRSLKLNFLGILLRVAPSLVRNAFEKRESKTERLKTAS